MQKLGIIGAGAWGTALAVVARKAGRDVVLWAFEPEVVAAVNGQHRNPFFLPDVALDSSIAATGDLAVAAKSDLIFLVVPAQFLRAICTRLAPLLAPGTPVVICAKGIEKGSGALMTDVVRETLPAAEMMVLSGPTFAAEVAAGLPTAITLGAGDTDLGGKVAAAIGSPAFRPYLSSDVIGAEVGGAVKNVLAIGNPDGTVGTWGSGAHRHFHAVAQLFPGRGIGPGPRPCRNSGRTTVGGGRRGNRRGRRGARRQDRRGYADLQRHRRRAQPRRASG